MRAAVICEYNPFHNGHKYLLDTIKTKYADEVVCIMSGSFVQRGDIAVTDKYQRATCALQHGADMIIELPAVYAVSSASVFAQSGVRLAHHTGCEILCFGAESDIDTLDEIATTLDSKEVNLKIAEKMQAGEYYPRAMQEAVAECTNASAAEVMSLPNNILAIEYIRACRQYNIKAVAIPRKDAVHDSDVASDSIASASKIRKLIAENASSAAYTPMTIEHPACLSPLENTIVYNLKTASIDDLSSLADVSEGLHNRIAEVAAKYNSVDEILTHLKTKRYTMARLRRILIYALLGITAEIQNTPVPYARVLGVRESKSSLISDISLPIIAKVHTDYEKLDNSAKEIFNIDIRATHAMNMAKNTDAVNEFSQGIIKI